MEIGGRSVMITGGCGGIGLEMGRKFAAAGKEVLLVDAKIDAGMALAQENPAISCIQCDLSSAQDIEHKLAGKSIDILINNVGISPKFDAAGQRVKTWTMTLDQWNAVMATNVTSFFLCTRLCLPGMMARKFGRIVNIASYAARIGGYQAAVHYTTSKAAVLGFTKSLAREVAPYGILVNAINPGRIETPMTRDVPKEVSEGLIPQISCGRLGVPKDIANVALFLCSDLADYMTGTAIEVNGGLYVGP
ncbi:SDR family NAD(P)-dependent oxidoreductase [Pseudorhodoplanes sp.]|uniref:SDR family oxidoreductase n=1 Tax=Pseudorhodoplanes sp. TaxID=1934341 RepID=UPI002C45EA73|nr:SDR family NAD(P)-dependent oxidoreductase [Pseudorhodoplanes sp.]HWV55412.1 SDR family NAD(P)-dependent oxidoreductase [Pseudorhodoplanes sp.]